MSASESTTTTTVVNNASAAPLGAKIATASSAVGTSGLYIGNGIAVIHWIFQCVAAKTVVEPDEVTAGLLAAMGTHLTAKINAWIGGDPTRVKTVEVAKIVASELEKAGVPAMVEKIAAGDSLGLGDKLELGKTLLDLSGKVDAILKATAPQPASEIKP